MAIIGVEFCGRFGNQMFQYAFARAYAELHKATFCVGPWVGQKIFDLADRPYTPLPKNDFDTIPWGQTNIALQGYFQNAEAVKILSVSKLREWFRLRPAWQQLVKPVAIAAHLRYGDYVSIGTYCLITKESYIKAVQNVGLDPASITWVSEDTPNPVTLPEPLGFLPDFLTLMWAKVLFRANSSFSWWAATLNPGEIFSPVVEGRVGSNNVEFVKGNWPRMADGSKCGCKLTDLPVSA